MAKILLFTKIYDTDAQTLKEVEESVQNDLDTYLGKPGMVKVKIEPFSDYLFYWLYRVYNDEIGKDLTYERRDSVRIDDCQLFTWPRPRWRGLGRCHFSASYLPSATLTDGSAGAHTGRGIQPGFCWK